MSDTDPSGSKLGGRVSFTDPKYLMAFSACTSGPRIRVRVPELDLLTSEEVSRSVP